MALRQIVVVGIVLAALAAGCSQPSAPPPKAAATPPPPRAGAINAARLANATSEPDQWLATGRDGAGTYFSPLTDINRDNVGSLGFAWERRLGTHRGLEATPVVVDGVLYTTGVFGWVYAMDAATGAERWTYDPEVDGQWGRYA